MLGPILRGFGSICYKDPIEQKYLSIFIVEFHAYPLLTFTVFHIDKLLNKIYCMIEMDPSSKTYPLSSQILDATWK